VRVAHAYPVWRYQLPPTDVSHSMDITGYEFVRRLRAYVDVVVYHNGLASGPRLIEHEGVLFRRVPGRPDQIGLKAVAALRKLRRLAGQDVSARPIESSVLHYLGYASVAGWDSRRRRCEVVHVYIYDSMIPVIKRLNPDARIVLHMRDSSQGLWEPALVGRRLARADAIVGNSGYIADTVRGRFPMLAERCRAILNPVDVHRFAPPDRRQRPQETLRILFVGRLSPEKGLETLVRAFNQVVEAHPSAELELVGPGNVAPLAFVDPRGEDQLFAGVRRFYDQPPERFRHHLVDLLSSRARQRVSFGGEVRHEELPGVYEAADVLVAPSLWNEPFGLPVAEAMASGLPVVATRAGAFPELVEHERTGLLFERGDADGLAAAIVRLANDRALRLELGERGRARACRLLTWERHVTSWVELYRELVEAGRPGASA
jgi:glycosyltransferase involved in cell wall biosynthesis